MTRSRKIWPIIWRKKSENTNDKDDELADENIKLLLTVQVLEKHIDIMRKRFF